MIITIMTISMIMIMCFAGRRIALGGRRVEMDESGSGWDGGGADCMGCLCMGIPYVGIPSIGIPSMGSPLPGDPLRLYIFSVLFKRRRRIFERVGRGGGGKVQLQKVHFKNKRCIFCMLRFKTETTS